MAKNKPISENSSNFGLSVLILFLTGFVFLASCSDDPAGPEPVQRTFIEAIIYYDFINGDLRYIEKTGENWGDPEIVAYAGWTCLYSSLGELSN